MAIAKQVVTALGYLHAHNIVYGDLNAKTVLLDNAGIVKIADLASAMFLCDSDLSGSPEELSMHVAPEVSLVLTRL